jgi:hypothetical protein
VLVSVGAPPPQQKGPALGMICSTRGWATPARFGEDRGAMTGCVCRARGTARQQEAMVSPCSMIVPTRS